MTAAPKLRLFAMLSLLVLPAPAAERDACCDHDHRAEESPHHPALDLPEDSTAIHFHPYLNAAVAIGGSTSEKNLDLVAGGHAPADDGFNLQGIEFGGLLEWGEAFSFRANANVFWDRLDGWDGEVEEAFAVVELPARARLLAGQFLVPFGLENQLHLHDRGFVEAPLSVVRLLGEEGLCLQGLGLALPLAGEWHLRLGTGHGRDHSHGEDRETHRETWLEALEHAAEDHEGEDHEDEEHGHHSHGVAGNGGIYDPEQAYLTDWFGTARLEGPIAPGLFAGFSAAFGENAGGRDTLVAGADLHGDFKLAGRPAWWRTEAFWRNAEARDPRGAPGEFSESGVHAALGCEFAEDWTAAARAEWASGNRMAGLERRWRFAANVGRSFHFSDQADSHLRLQYTCDRLGGYGDEHSVWLQWVINFGAAHHH